MLLVKLAILLLWLGAVIDPVGNFFGIRYIALAVMLLALAFLFLFGKINDRKLTIRWAFVLILGVLLPVYGLVLYSFRGEGGEFIDTSYIASGILMLASLLYVNKSMCEFGVKALVLSGRLISFLVGLLLFSQIYSFDWISHFFLENSIAFLGAREYSGFIFPYIYIVTSPILILLLSYDFSRLREKINLNNFILFIFTTISLALTGTRAHILISFTFIFIYILLTSSRRIFKKILFFLILILLAIFVFNSIADIIGSFFSINDESNSLKLSMLKGYWEIFSNPINLIFGQGFNAHEWSLPLENMIAMDIGASKTELTYIEIIRVFGVLIGCSVFILLFNLVVSVRGMKQDYEWVYPGLVILLINASINPYLFSTNGILPLGLFAAMVSNGAFQKIKH